MAERLTEIGMFIDTPVYKIKNGKKGEAVDKLAKLEDILEKYGIESLDTLEHIIKKGQVITSTIEGFAKEAYNEILTDRDTWKRACELACDVLRDINYKIYNEDRIDFENTFYQQAKKESENNDTNN